MGKEITKRIIWSVAFWTCLLISITLITASFILPPTGKIDPSVLTAVGELFAFATLYVVMDCVRRGIDAKLTHNNTTIELTNDEKEN